MHTQQLSRAVPWPLSKPPYRSHQSSFPGLAYSSQPLNVSLQFGVSTQRVHLPHCGHALFAGIFALFVAVQRVSVSFETQLQFCFLWFLLVNQCFSPIHYIGPVFVVVVVVGSPQASSSTVTPQAPSSHFVPKKVLVIETSVVTHHSLMSWLKTLAW